MEAQYVGYLVQLGVSGIFAWLFWGWMKTENQNKNETVNYLKAAVDRKDQEYQKLQESKDEQIQKILDSHKLEREEWAKKTAEVQDQILTMTENGIQSTNLMGSQLQETLARMDHLSSLIFYKNSDAGKGKTDQ